MSDNFVSLCIEQINATDFEIWAQEVLALAIGESFEPTGGMHDGGQDGFVRSVTSEPTHYIQISKQKNTTTKIRETIKKLRGSRQVEKLTYVTSQQEPHRDLLEAQLSAELGVQIIIHDLRWLMVRASIDDNLKQSLFSYSKNLVEGLKSVQASDKKLNVSSRLSIVAYLEAHVRSLPGAENFQNVCLDTLIYNALIGTDPDTNDFRTSDEIEKFIRDEHPNVLSKAENTLAQRIEFLCSKDNDPRIRYHPIDRYALPYSVRSAFHKDNLQLETDQDRFIGSINTRFNEFEVSDAELLRPFVITCVQSAIIETYQTQGMNFAASFSRRDFDTDIRVFDIIDKLIQQLDIPKELTDEVRHLSSTIFRNVCYSSNEEEREYLNLLMKFFTIRFLMDGDSAVSQYFSEMASNLRIYVGTDIIVRCLSEALVNEQSRGMTNSLKLLRSGGVRLRVTRQTVQEIFAHIRHTTGIFRREYEFWFRHAKLDEVKNSDRILIRSFFYAYLEPERHVRKPRDWSDYLRNFGAAAWFAKTDEMTSEEYIDEFASFLIDKYQLEFIDIDEVLETIDTDLAEKIAECILKERDAQTDGSRILARNDAEMALFVNAERHNRQERVSTNLYGYNTWWLTEETAVLRALKQLSQRQDVVMHPQFLMNHFILDPTFIRKNLSNDQRIMPTLFGLRITDRVSPTDMRDFIRGIGDLAGLDEAAQNARIRHSANKLKRGQFRTPISSK